MKFFVFLLFFVLSFSFLVPTVTAAENFTTAYDVTYDVNEASITHVTMKVTLTNTTSQYYASSYKIHLGFDDIENLSVTDPNGEIQPKLEKTEEGHSIAVTFNKRVVGKGNSLPFTVSFDTKDIAQSRGSTRIVNIPGVSDQEAFADFTITVKVPDSFGNTSFVKPKRSATEPLTFTKKELGEGGISLAFGEKQAYDFYLTYHLQNTNIFPIRTEIALPPTTNYQEVLFSSIEPKPINVKEDKDGNWLAEYQLRPSERFDVIVRGKAYLSLTPKKEPMSEASLRDYLKSQEYWQVTDPEIKKLAAELKTPQAIYDYVVKTLQYDFTRVTDSKARLGAANALNNPDSAVCLEFTDLFIAITRAAGIPAREVNGYAYTENDRQRPLSLVKDILHAWPEYYDRERETWVMIDPTWGSTTGGIDYFTVLDYDHFTFVRKGMKSTYPVPAGGYKANNGEDGKDVHVEFGSIEPVPAAKVSIIPEFQEKLWSFLTPSGTVRVRNLSQGLLPQQTLTVRSSTLRPLKDTMTIGEIPPYGVIDIPIAFAKQPFLTNSTHTFTIQFANASFDHTIGIVPFLLPDLRILGGITFAVLSIIIFIIAVKSRRLPFLRRR